MTSSTGLWTYSRDTVVPCTELQKIEATFPLISGACSYSWKQMRIRKSDLVISLEVYVLGQELGSLGCQPCIQPNESEDCRHSRTPLYRKDNQTRGDEIWQRNYSSVTAPSDNVQEVLSDQQEETCLEHFEEDQEPQSCCGVSWRLEEGHAKWPGYRPCALRRHERDFGKHSHPHSPSGAGSDRVRLDGGRNRGVTPDPGPRTRLAPVGVSRSRRWREFHLHTQHAHTPFWLKPCRQAQS